LQNQKKFSYEIKATDESFTMRPEMCIKKVKRINGGFIMILNNINRQSKAVTHRETAEGRKRL